MSETLEAKIRQAAENVIHCEKELDKAIQIYDALCADADQKGVEVPRTLLTNPFMRRP